MLPIYARFLRGEGYGIIGMIDVVLSVLAVFIGHGFSIAMTRYYFQENSENKRKILISTNLITMFALITLVSSPALFLNNIVAEIAFGRDGLGLYIILAVCSFIFTTSGANAGNYILIKRKAFLFSAFSIAGLIMSLVLHVYFIVILRLGVLGYLYAGLICSILLSAAKHIYVFLSVGVQYNINDSLEFLKFSLPLVPGLISNFLRNNVSRIIIRSHMGLSELGAFEMLFKFATLIGVFITEPFSKSWGPKRMEICDYENGPFLISRMFTLQLYIMLFLGLILALEIPLLLKILLPKEFWLGGYIALFAVMSRILIASYTHFQFPLVYAKVTYKISIIQFISAFLSILLNLYFIKNYKILGAFIAACIVGIFQCVLAYILSYRYYKIPFQWKNIIALISISLITFFSINSIDFQNIEVLKQFGLFLKKPVESFLNNIHLSNLMEGRITKYFISNINLVVECIIKLLLSFSFLIASPFTGINVKNIKRILISKKVEKNNFKI
jgi:O-antigen/teichoic acid export membrane protein